MRQQVLEQLMKADYKSTSEVVRIMRRYTKAAAKVAHKKVGSNQENVSKEFFKQSAQYQSDWAKAKKVARTAHLARMFVKGLPYQNVESYTREGNNPDLGEVYSVLKEWGVKVTFYEIEEWFLEDDPSPLLEDVLGDWYQK